MNTATICATLQGFIRVIDNKKLKAIYVLLEEEINQTESIAYIPARKSELDPRVTQYQKDGKLVTSAEMNKRLQTLRKKRKKMTPLISLRSGCN
jgi:hypothetical protein